MEKYKPSLNDIDLDMRLAVKILRSWYGDRPVVILADEVGKSKDEALVRQELCRAMDVWGGQVFVVMSALTSYAAAVEMFGGSNRKVYIITLTDSPWHWCLYDLFPPSSLNCRIGENL